MTCKNVVFDELWLDVSQKIRTWNNMDKEECTLNCEFEKKCNLFYYDHLLEECTLFKSKLDDFQVFANELGAPKDCNIKFDSCVS